MPDIVVGQVTVPNVLGNDETTALGALDAVYLFGVPRYLVSPGDTTGTVIAQNIAGTTNVDPQTNVIITIAIDPFWPIRVARRR